MYFIPKGLRGNNGTQGLMGDLGPIVSVCCSYLSRTDTANKNNTLKLRILVKI
jgi:hypothetical protein